LLTGLQKDANVFGTKSGLLANISMTAFAPSSLLSQKPAIWFRAELFRVVILLVIFIITGVAVTPTTSG
jgi:hypothetical protein